MTRPTLRLPLCPEDQLLLEERLHLAFEPWKEGAMALPQPTQPHPASAPSNREPRP